MPAPPCPAPSGRVSGRAPGRVKALIAHPSTYVKPFEIEACAKIKPLHITLPREMEKIKSEKKKT